MSIVAEVISSVKQKGGGLGDSACQMEELVRQSEEARVNVCQALGSRYSSLSTAFHDALKLQDRLDTCLQNILELNKRIENEVMTNVESSIGEVGRVSERWKEVTGELEATKTLLAIHNLLEESHQSQFNNEFFVTAQMLNKVELLLQDAAEKEIESQLEIISTLKEELTIKRNELIYKVGEVWTNSINWAEEEWNDGSHSVCLKIQILEKTLAKTSMEVMKQLFTALHSLGELQRYIRSFGKNLLQYCFKPIIQDGGVVKIDPCAEAYVMQVIKPPKDSNAGLKCSATQVLHRLQQIFEFLYKVFFEVTLDSEQGEVSLISLLGVEIGEEFTKLVLKDCLAESIPCSRKDLKNFDEVQEKADEINKYLVSIGFFSPDQKSLLDYAANVENVFSNKACANILSKSRDLMLKPLHVTATITPLSPGKPIMATDEAGNTLEKTSYRLQNVLSAKTFNLPKCQVSLSVCELVDLIYETLEEACTSTPEYAGRLFYTVRNILTIYCHVVPMAHAHTLSTIPQHAALVHNNSLFLAHHALLLGHQYRNRLPAALRDSSLTTTDLGQLLRASGGEVFLQSMQNHKITLIETLKEGSASPSLGCDPTAVSCLEVSVKQCLRQLERLHSVWQNVLPHSVYKKAIGALAGSVVEDIVIRIVGLQDISADAALGLINVLSLLKDHVPSLFKISDEEDTSKEDVIREVCLWEKMNELMVVLGASLRELIDRWSDGKGPLALYFSPEEAKQLIRALFQNTERRAHVLARIK